MHFRIQETNNKPQGRKWFITITAIAAVTNSTFASSLPSGVMGTIQKNLNVPHEELTILTISLFLLGYVIGPIGFAPFSEFYGRRWVSIIAFAWFVIFTICCAFAPNIGALLAFRFLAGVGASAPMSVVRTITFSSRLSLEAQANIHNRLEEPSPTSGPTP